jgi:hypothetical protein
MISITPALSCPPSTTEFLFIKEVKTTSDLMNFIDTNMNILNESSYPSKLYFLPWMSIDEKYDNSTFDIILINNSENIKIFETKLISLKNWGHNYGNDKNYIYYEFPTKDFYENLNKTDTNLSHFDNKILLISLDGMTLRGYVIGYEPAHLYPCYSYLYPDPFSIGLIVLFSIAIIIIIVFLVRKKK